MTYSVSISGHGPTSSSEPSKDVEAARTEIELALSELAFLGHTISSASINGQPLNVNARTDDESEAEEDAQSPA